MMMMNTSIPEHSLSKKNENKIDPFPNDIDTSLIVIVCASNSTLQDIKIQKSSGVYAYRNSDELTSVTSNRYIVWRTFDDVLELSEHSLNRDLHFNELRIQFKNSLILHNGVTIQETADKIIILVTTIVSAHRLIFPHPNRVFSNPNPIGSLSCLGSSSSSSSTSTYNNSPCYSIFHNVMFEDAETNFVQLQNSFTQSSILGSPAVLPYLATCSWIENKSLDAYFILSTTTGTLQIIKLPYVGPNPNHSAPPEIKIQNFDLKQNNLIGKLFNGIVPSIINKTTVGTEAAVNLLTYDTPDDNLIFALCRDGRIRVVSLKQQDFLIIHSLFNQSLLNKDDTPSKNSQQSLISKQKPLSMKFWWYENETYFPNLVVYVTDAEYNKFYFYQVVIPNLNSPTKNHHNHRQQQPQRQQHHHSVLSFSNTSTSSGYNVEPHLRYLFQKKIPSHYELLDYFVYNCQLWTMWQHNETINLQYYSIDNNYETVAEPQPFEWMPVIADLNSHPEIGLRSPLVNPREYYLQEIFWRGNFSLRTISKAISVLNRTIGNEKNEANKIDLLIQEAIKLVDNIIRNQAENQLEMNVEEYIQQEVNAWNKLYQFCLEYHVTENEPLSIFVDAKTGIKGIVRKARLEFIPALNPFDDLINHYFLHCKQNHLQHEQMNGDVRTGNSVSVENSLDLFSISAFEYRFNTLIESIQESSTLNLTTEMLSGIENMKNSILALMHVMSAINVTLKDEDLLDFEAFMQRMSSYSTKTNLSLADITKKITEDSLLSDISLMDNSLSTLIDDFFEKCPCVVEAIKFFIIKISFDFLNKNDLDDYLEMNNEMQILQEYSNQDVHLKMEDALQFEIKPLFSNLLTSLCGLEFTVTNIGRILQMRYKFCRDLFLLQYMLTSFHSNVKSDYESKVIQDIQRYMIPYTSQLLFALNHLNWTCETPMITPNIWWTNVDNPQQSQSRLENFPQIISLNASPSTATGGTTINSNHRGTTFENSELLSVLEMKDYINLNRVGLLSHESVFYDAYPQANILYFFIQFSGGNLAKRLLSYTLHNHQRYNQAQVDETIMLSGDGIWSSLIPSYMNSICQLLWPFSAGQFKLAEFLLGVGQYHLVERYVDKLHPWCTIFSYSRYFSKGICYLMTGEGEKAITQFKQSVFGINSEPFLFKIFAQKPKLEKLKETQIEMVAGDQQADTENGEKTLANNDRQMKNLRQNFESNMSLFLNARTIFRYYNKLIQLFNRYSTPDQVIELADCALKSLDKDTDPEYDQHHSALQTVLFACHLRLGNIEEAYLAMINNNNPDQQQNCLRQFIVNLCEMRKFKELVSYSYIGLVDNFVAILESKARSSCLRKTFSTPKTYRKSASEPGPEQIGMVQTNYYHILYSYFMNTFNYRRAAQVIYDYYRQLSQEFNGGNVDTLKTQANALLIARNCLKCLDDLKYAWIVKNSIKKTDHMDRHQTMKRKRGYFSDNSNDNYDQEKTIIEIVDIGELLRDYELISVRIKLLEKNPKEYAIAATPLNPDETIVLCISAQLYEQAFKIGELFDQPLEPIFEGMASKYVHLLNGRYNRRRIDDEIMETLLAESSFEYQTQKLEMDAPKIKFPIDDDNFTIELFDVFYENTASNSECDFICYSSLSICDRMWYMILYYLYRYETQPTMSTKYLKTVAEKLLSNGIMLPVSMMKIYKKSNCPELIRLLVTYNFLTEATELSIDYMNAFMGHGTEFFDLKLYLFPNCEPLCIPSHIFDCLLQVLMNENQQQQKLKQIESMDNKFVPLSVSSIGGDYDPTASSSVDDDESLLEQFIDYDMLIKNLTKTRQTLEKLIISCSRV